jgi:hypothetical protein
MRGAPAAAWLAAPAAWEDVAGGVAAGATSSTDGELDRELGIRDSTVRELGLGCVVGYQLGCGPWAMLQLG